jgi:hypothetical protein
MKSRSSNSQTWIPDFGQARRGGQECDMLCSRDAASKQALIKRVLRHENLVFLDFLVEGTARDT